MLHRPPGNSRHSAVRRSNAPLVFPQTRSSRARLKSRGPALSAVEGGCFHVSSVTHTNSGSNSGGRQPLLWAALAFAAGIAVGVHSWRPPVWWVAAWIVFALSGAYLFRRRGPPAFILGLGALFFLAALMVQVRGLDDAGNSGVLRFADGSEVAVTAHVTKEGILQEDGPGSIRQRLEVETEEVARGDQKFAVNSGLANKCLSTGTEKRASIRKPAPHPHSVTASAFDFPPKFPRRATTAIRGRSITGDISRKTGSSLWPPPKPRASKCSRALPAAGLNSGGRGSIAASSTKSTPSGRRGKLR